MKKWFILFSAILFVFRGAFSTYIFQDDFFLFVSSRILDLGPLKSYGFYRPIGIDLFYYTAGIINNLAITHVFIFFVFGLGLIFLYKSFNLFFKNSFSFLATVMYALSFNHVYQLYWLATFQEVVMFTFCAASFYLFFRKNLLFIPFFIFAALSREEAFLLPVLILAILVFKKLFDRKLIMQLFILIILTIPFVILYEVNYGQVAVRPEYAPQFNLKIISNNFLWYFFWSLGLPGFLPDFLPSIFAKPLPGLWQTIQNTGAYWYLGFLVCYLTVFVFVFKKPVIKFGAFCLFLFSIYIIPISFIIHKWPVRLTIPLIFIILFQAFIITKLNKYLVAMLLVLYFTYNFLAISVHENTSTYKYESSISLKAKNIISNNNCLYFADDVESKSGWEGSQKLKLTLFDQWFTRYYRPDKNIKVYYGFETKVAPVGCTIINSRDLL
ncbi:MAG: hypothetical protein AAB838_01815 [Patescibacteria group bacterium]